MLSAKYPRLDALNRGRSCLHRRALRQRLFSTRAAARSISTLGTGTPADTMARRTPNNSTAARSDILTRHSAMILHSSGAQTDPSVQSHSEPSFYSEDVDRYAATDLQPVTLGSLLRICEPPLTRESLLENSQFLCSERPVRYAKRVKLFQRLPYIVGLNPHLNEVYQIYYRHFEESRKFPMVESLGDQRKFIQMLARQSDTLKDVMPKIARGFYESRRYFSTEDRCQFLDHLVKMRIGLRLLTSQHIALYHQYQATVNGTYDEETDTGRYQGIIDNQLKLAHMVRVCAQGVQAMCDMAYGEAPNFTIDGQANVTFRYIPSHLEYMLVELLKNAFRSTLQNAKDREEIPPVKITISKGNGRVAIRIRDFGGGIPSEIQDSVFDYSFTTVKHRSVDGDEDQGEATTEALHSAQPGQSPIAGLGFGLPMTKLYAEYFGGSLNLISLEGYGCDVFLELPSIKVSRSPKIQI